MGRTTYDVTPEQLIVRGLDWCTKFKIYSDDDSSKASKAVTYNTAWVQLIRRIFDYTKNNDNLIRIYVGLKQTSRFDPEIKEIICSNLKKKGIERGLLYFISTEDITQMLETGDFKLHEQQPLDISK